LAGVVVRGFHLKVGDRVRIIHVPPDLPEDERLKTRSLFELCVGRVFPIFAFNDAGWLELEVGELLGKDPCMDSIWIEPEFCEIVETTN
jgi:hypothetical protein